MLNTEDSRRLPQLYRHLWRDDPDFCERMAGGRPHRKRVPIALVLIGTVIWVAALILAVAGWWIAAAITGLWATVILSAAAYRSRPSRRVRPTDPDLAPPW